MSISKKGRERWGFLTEIIAIFIDAFIYGMRVRFLKQLIINDA